MDVPETRYATTADGVYLAYQVVGEGPVDVAWQFDFVGNVDLVWDDTILGPLFRGIASFARLILHDRRGTGLSSRNVPPPNLETRVADLRAVLDAVGSERPVLAGVLEGGASNVLLAASSPERVQSIVWWGLAARSLWSPDYPWGAGPEYVEANERELQHWGTLEGARLWAEGESLLGRVITEEEIRDYAKLSRHTATPDVARELQRIWYETDIRPVLPSVNVPALLLDQHTTQSDVEETQYVASLMPQAELKVMPKGVLSSPEVLSAVVDEIRRFVGVEPPMPELDTVLATVLFTDIVGSTERAAEMGDRRWRELLDEHHRVVRRELERHRGREIHTAGDGFLMTFDGPARAIRCALSIHQALRAVGIEIRAGLHTGEVELQGDDIAGIAVHTGARVASVAGAGQTLVSRTVVDLVAGSQLTFEDAGEHVLKGVPDRWHLYRVVSGSP